MRHARGIIANNGAVELRELNYSVDNARNAYRAVRQRAWRRAR